MSHQTPTNWSECPTVSLQTQRRDGTWVATAVSLVVEHDRAFFRTYDASGKAKRLSNFPGVRVAPSTLRGRPTGPYASATARLLHGQDAQHARELLAKRFPVMHGRLVPWMHRRKGWETLHYQLDFDADTNVDVDANADADA